MVEVAAKNVVNSVKQSLQDSGVPFLQEMPGGLKKECTPHRLRKFLEFMDFEWKEGAVSRTKIQSVEDGIEQQIRLVGSKAIYERVNKELSREHVKKATTDIFFVGEQLLLYKWRLDFIRNFFPVEAAAMSSPSTPGWWSCSGAPLQVHYELAGLGFDFVLHKAFHMGEDEVVDIDQAWSTSIPLLWRTFSRAYYNQYMLIREGSLSDVFSIIAQSGVEAEGLTFSFLKQVILALYSQGPPSLCEIAIQKVLELGLPQDELPREVKTTIATGPVFRPLTDVGQEIWEYIESVGENRKKKFNEESELRLTRLRERRTLNQEEHELRRNRLSVEQLELMRNRLSVEQMELMRNRINESKRLRSLEEHGNH